LRVDGERIKGYIETVSTDEYEGRQSCTPGYQRAAEWLAAQYEAFGLEPAGENGTWFQTVPIGRAFTTYEGTPVLAVGQTRFDLSEGDYSLLGQSTVATRAGGEVVFVGYGVSAPGKGLDEYAGIDVNGKVVLVMRGDPTDMPAGGGRGGSMAPSAPSEAPPDVDFTAESTDLAKIETAYEKGAAAILLYEPDQDAPTVRFGRGGGQDGFMPDRDFLSFSITARVFNAIMKTDPQESLGGLGRRVNGYRQAIQYLKSASFATGSMVRLSGYESSTVYSDENGNLTAPNVLAKITGTDRRLRNEYIIMGGHLDHLGVRNGLVYNGADDNASGTMVALEVARVLSEAGYRPRRTIIFAGWCGEEMGLIGSRYYVNNPTDGVTMDQVVTAFNMDMVGLGTHIGAPGALNFPSIYEVIIRNQDADVMAALLPRTGGPGGSDHSGFIELGIESFALMTSGGVGHTDYHQPEDDTWKIDPEILRKTGQFVLQGTINLAEERQAQLLIPDRQHLYNAVMLSLQSFNPGAEGNRYQVIDFDFPDTGALAAAILDSARAQIARARAQAAGNTQMQQMMRNYGGGGRAASGRSVYRGIDDFSIFGDEDDMELFFAASEFIGFGRIDFDGNMMEGDPAEGDTEEARKFFARMEEEGIVIHLSNPPAGSLEWFTDNTSRPFIVSGDYQIEADEVASINEQGVLLAVTMDPDNVDACIADLNRLKALLGDADNLVLSITDESDLDTAKKALYMGLIEAGWTHEEIAGVRRGQGGIAGGNLGTLAGGGAAGRMR
ncbi:M20/M25/M40 family metallo-hydrolase, partial [Gemmatimonadota bacterium]